MRRSFNRGMKRVLMLASPLAGVLVLAAGAILNLSFAATVISAASAALALEIAVVLARRRKTVSSPQKDES